jgi:outer membrane lipoprotein-sorting protein
MKLKFASLFSLLFASLTAFAGNGGEFSAEFTQSAPQQDEQHGKIYVGDGRMRMEFDADGSKIIQIVDSRTQTVLMINTEEKTYMRQGGQGGMMPGAAPADSDNPCAGMKNITCKRLGDEKIHGRLAEQWEFSSTTAGQSGTMTTWLDKERRTPLRQIMPDGSGMELALVGHETVSGRKTEKWEIKSIGPDGQSQVSYQWFDPELKTNLREENPNGFVREMRNIKPGKQPDSLFTVPDGYKEITMSQGSGSR